MMRALSDEKNIVTVESLLQADVSIISILGEDEQMEFIPCSFQRSIPFFDSVDLIVDKIFQHLDCDSLLQLRDVGETWKTAVDKAPVWKNVLKKDVRWKRMFNIMRKQNKLSESNGGEKADSYLGIYNRIHSALQELENNWRTRKSYGPIEKFPYETYCESVHFVLKTNECYLVIRKNYHALEVIDRRNLSTEHVFDVGPESRVMVKNVEINDQYIVAGCNRGKSFLWDLQTKELLDKMTDDTKSMAQGDQSNFAEKVMASRTDCSLLKFNHTGDLLLSCFINNGCQMESLTIRKFISHGKTKVLCQAVLDQFYVRRLFVENNKVLILRTNCIGVEVRSIVSLELIKIVGDTESGVKEFQPYENKWLILAGSDNISVWNSDTNVCIRRIRMEPSDGVIKAMGLISSKFIVTSHILRWSIDWYPLEFKVWDIRSMIEAPRQMGNSANEDRNDNKLTPIHTFNETTQSWYETPETERDAILEKFKIFIDDYQVSFLITWEFDTIQRVIPVPMIYRMNFE